MKILIFGLPGYRTRTTNERIESISATKIRNSYLENGLI